MLQAYEGYFENGKIFPVGLPAGIVGRRKAIITILDEPPESVENNQRAAAWEEFFAEIEACDEEVPEFERVKFREVDI